MIANKRHARFGLSLAAAFLLAAPAQLQFEIGEDDAERLIQDQILDADGRFSVDCERCDEAYIQNPGVSFGGSRIRLSGEFVAVRWGATMRISIAASGSPYTTGSLVGIRAVEYEIGDDLLGSYLRDAIDLPTELTITVDEALQGMAEREPGVWPEPGSVTLEWVSVEDGVLSIGLTMSEAKQ